MTNNAAWNYDADVAFASVRGYLADLRATTDFQTGNLGDYPFQNISHAVIDSLLDSKVISEEMQGMFPAEDDALFEYILEQVATLLGGTVSDFLGSSIK